MDFSSRVLLVISLILLLIWTGAAEGNQILYADMHNNTSPSPNIFKFAKASPIDETVGNITFHNSFKTERNASTEAYYNNLSIDADNSPLHLNFLGIPMECQFCLPFRILQMRS